MFARGRPSCPDDGVHVVADLIHVERVMLRALPRVKRPGITAIIARYLPRKYAGTGLSGPMRRHRTVFLPSVAAPRVAGDARD